MKEKFKLKHLNVLTEDESKQDLSILMIDILDYKNSFFGKTKWFVKNFLKIKKISKNISEIDYETITLNEKSHIIKPNSVNEISYSAMLDLQQIISNGSNLGEAEHIARVISIVTHDLNRLSKYSHGSKENKRYQEQLLETSLFDMIGLYNWILKDLKDTSLVWEKLFLSVEVVDKDLEAVGGSVLSQFNVINTIKSICLDFNVTEKEAWNSSYNLVMTNNYSKAYAGFLQDQIRIKKEAELLAKSKQQQ